MGSGMGMLIEALWNFYMNEIIRERAEWQSIVEIAWMPFSQYNDYACLNKRELWDMSTRKGEFFRMEAKSMNVEAEESKGHFDEIQSNIGAFDQLLVLVWRWQLLENDVVYPAVIDQFFGYAREIATLRDRLHVARGGSFVDRSRCPDTCRPAQCIHHGEPLNASGKRERRSGPEACRVSRNTSHAQNFGGLVRMLKTETPEARRVFRELRRDNDTCHKYISFIHRNFPAEEENQYLSKEWRKVAAAAGIVPQGLSKSALVAAIRAAMSHYQETLRNISN
jgi:hypothetical protein